MPLTTNIILFLASITFVAIDALTWINDSTSLPFPLYGACSGTHKDKSSIYLLGGYLNESSLSMSYIYKFNGNKIEFIKSLNTYILCRRQSSTTVSNMIYSYLMEGKDLPYIFTFDTDTETNDEIAIPYYGEYTFQVLGGSPCLTSNGTHLFMVGSIFCSADDCITLQMYNIVTQTWSSPHSIQNKTDYIAATACGYYENKVYAFGGFSCAISAKCWFSTNESNSILFDNYVSDLIWSYNLTSNEWKLESRLSNGGQYGAKAIMPQNDGIFYILAGSKQESAPVGTSIVHKFYSTLSMTIQDSNLVMPVSVASVEFMNEQIYVIGGMHINATSLIQKSNSFVPTLSPTVSPTMLPTLPPSNSTVAPNEEEYLKHQTNLWKTIVFGMSGFLFCSLLFFLMRRLFERWKQRKELSEYLMEGQRENDEGIGARILGHNVEDTAM